MLIEILDPDITNGTLKVICPDGETYISETQEWSIDYNVYEKPTIEFTIRIPLGNINADI